MTTLADKSLLSGGDNKPPMLEKHLYDSWKSRMELYMLNRPHGRMILASVEKGPLVWPSITEDGVTRLKEYVELTPAEAIQADCDIKAINIILQGLQLKFMLLKESHYTLKDFVKTLIQATIYDGKVNCVTCSGRHNTYAAGSTRKYTLRSGKQPEKQQLSSVNNCKGEGHNARSVLKPKRKRMKRGFNDKLLLVSRLKQVDKVLKEEENSILARSRIPDTQTSQTDSLMANLSRNGSDVLTEYKSDNLTMILFNQSEQIMTSSEQSNDNSNSSAQQDVLILSMFEQLNTQVMHCTNVNLEYKSANKALTTKLDRYKEEEQGLVIAALKNKLRKLKGKALDKEAIKTHSVDPKVSKDNMEPITPKLRLKPCLGYGIESISLETLVLINHLARHDLSKTLREYYEKVGISHETSVARSPQQNGVVERRNHTLIEAAHTMLIYQKAPLFLWAEAIATDPLKKALYGLKQAPRAWYDMLSSFLISNDFSKGSVDPTLFIRREGKELLLVQIYVDDIIFAASTPELYFSKSQRHLHKQLIYALESLKKYGFESCDPVDTPMVEKSKLDEDKEGKAVDPSHYRGMIGTLLYLTASRPDLQFAICMCARYQARPTKKHLKRFYTSAGNPVREILLKLNLPDHRILKDGGEDFRYSDTERLSRSDEVLKLKNFKKDATLKLFKSTNQERYEHVGPEVTSYTRWQDS
ncbi:retrovirus-related pol polyprotein from transposon TNT 1-94 [Tanacetum coccineum]